MSTVPESTDNGAPKPVSVYVIGHDGSGVAKIGKADDVDDRLASIQRMSPVKLRVLTRFDGGFKLETALHRRFKHLRLHGEWFDFGEADPAQTVADAVSEIEAAWAAAEAKEPEPAPPPGEPAGVFLIRGRLWVMPAEADGGWRCVGQNSSRRRCNTRIYVHTSGTGPSWIEWVIPGVGTVTGQNVDSDVNDWRKDAEASRQEQAMRQLCDRHFAALDPVIVAEPAWVPFDPVEHDSLIIRFQYRPGSYLGLAPGFDAVQAKVEAYATRLLASKAQRKARGSQS